MSAYYNEIDPYAAQWLRNLIAAGHIAAGDVDERSIEDVHPHDLKPYTQCHFFAGIGIWSLALRRAGWSDDRPVWTGSCPCQPFSTAGEGLGFDDSRHLWPAFAWLISERRPAVIFGEQVAGKAVEPWIDLVQTDLETLEYAFGDVPFPSAGVGAPHIRDRSFWVADLYLDGRNQGRKHKSTAGNDGLERNSAIGRLEHAGRHDDAGQVEATCTEQPQADRPSNQSGGSDVPSSGVADTCGVGWGARWHRDNTRDDRPISGSDVQGSSLANAERGYAPELAGQRPRSGDPQSTGASGESQGCRALPDPQPAGPVNGFWATADWLLCRDGKWRPVEPGTFPLAHGNTSRVGRLRAYGNAINAEAATQFIAAYREVAAI